MEQPEFGRAGCHLLLSWKKHGLQSVVATWWQQQKANRVCFRNAPASPESCFGERGHRSDSLASAALCEEGEQGGKPRGAAGWASPSTWTIAPGLCAYLNPKGAAARCRDWRTSISSRAVPLCSVIPASRDGWGGGTWVHLVQLQQNKIRWCLNQAQTASWKSFIGQSS